MNRIRIGVSAALLGGGHPFRAGEVCLAHRGVLFLDELPEFRKNVLEVLRQPLEEGMVRVARAHAKVDFPARILLVAAMNPCPCGEGTVPGACRCSPTARARYARRLSGPLVDRFDLRVDVGRPDVADLLSTGGGEASSSVVERVAAVRRRSAERGVPCNARLPAWRLDDVAPLDREAQRPVARPLRAGRLTRRGLGGGLRVGRATAAPARRRARRGTRAPAPPMSAICPLAMAQKRGAPSIKTGLRIFISGKWLLP